MIEPCVPFSFINQLINTMENELEYQLFEDDDRDETLKLSHQIDMLKTLKRKWLDYDKRFTK